MLRFFTLTAIALMATSLSFAQNSIFEAVETAKNSSITFKNAKPLAEKGNVAKNGKFQTSLSEGILFEMNKNSLTNLTNESNEALRFEIEKGEGKKPLVLELVKTELLGADFRVLTDSSPNQGVDFTAGIHYRGIVAGDRNSAVALSIFNGEIMSVINSESSGNLVLGKTSEEGEEYILYNPADATDKPPFDCGTADIPLTQDQIDGMMNYQNTAGKVDNCVNVFLELDYTLVTEKGGRQGAINYVTGLFNVVATLYQAEEITIKISEMFVWENEDPYAASTSINALLLFRETRSEFNGDLAHLISRGAPAGGGVAWVNALCTNYNYAYSYVFNNYNQLPSYSWSVNVIAHEMGHNLGSPHTHACTWNGDNTPIDGCGAQAGYSEGCEGPIPTDGGTVMSYCHLLSGVGIDMNNGFGQQPGDLIRNAINNAGCLTSCSDTPPPPPAICQTISITKDDSRCFGEADGTVKVNITDGTAPFRIQWSNGMTGDSLDNLPAGDYSVVVTDANDCVDTASTTILQPAEIILVTSVQNESFPGANDGNIIVTASGGTPPYTYRWAAGTTTQSINDLTAGNYSVVVTDAKYCSSFFAGTIRVISDCPTLAISKTDLTCFDSKNGTATVSGTGGITPYAYLWSNGQTTATATGLEAGTHTVYVTDRNKCRVETSVSIAAPSQLMASGIVSDETVSGSSNGRINLAVSGGTPPYSFLWSDGSNNQNLTNKPAGSYSVEVFDANQCQTVYQANIDVSASCHSIAVSKTNINCFGENNGTASVRIEGGTAPFSINWSNGSTGTFASPLNAGVHFVIVEDANNCVDSSMFSIAQPDALSVSGTVSNETVQGAENGSISLNIGGGTGPYTYSWSNGSSERNISNLSSGTYSVSIFDANQCVTSYSGTVGFDAVCHSISTTKTDVSCANGDDGSATVQISGGTAPFQIEWSNGDSNPTTDGLTTGNYSVLVTDANGCVTEAGVRIDQPTQLEINGNITNETVSGLNNGAIDIAVFNGTPPYRFEWSNGQTAQSISNLSAGNYSVIATDANGCSVSFTGTIQSGALCHTISITKTDATCAGANDGTAVLNIENGTAPFQLLWEDQNNMFNRNDLSAGEYSVTVVDANGCFAEAKTTIKEPTQLVVSGAAMNESAPNAGDGNVQVMVSGGTPPYRYLWSNNSTDESLENLTAGDYWVEIFDANNCLVVFQASVGSTALCQTISIEKNDVRCFGLNDGFAKLNITNGTAPFIIEWSTGESSQNIDLLPTGDYSVIVTDAAGCVATAQTTIEQPNELTVTGNIEDAASAALANGSIELSIEGGTAPYQIEWSNGSTDKDLNNLSAGTYEANIYDANQCFTTFSATISEKANCHEITIEKTNGSCFDSNDGSAEISISRGTAPFEIQWSNGLNSNTNAGLAPGDYSVIVMDATGCFAEAKTTIEAPDQITVSSQSTNESAPGETDGEISLNVTGGTLPFTFEWSNGSTTQDLSNVNGGDYSVIITDANGCSISYSETIETNVVCHEITVEKADASCFDSNDGSASVNISGGLPPFSIEWSHGATSEQVNNLEPGEYQVFVFDANGCFASASFKIEAPKALVIEFEKTNLSEEGANDGKVNLTVSGGTAPYSIEWSNGSTAEDLTNLEVGFYEVFVTDAAGCFEATEVEITAPVSFNCTPLVDSYQGFEKGWKEWTQESEDGMTWSLKSGKTPTRKTGPSRAKKGKIYTYMEASSNHGKSASLISPCYDLSGTISPKLTFSYHMKGIDQGALVVEISTDAGETWEDGIFNLEGHQANGWKNAVIDLSRFAFQTIKVKITGTIGDGNKSDIALDRIRVTDQGSTLPSTKEADGLVDLRNLAIAPNPVIDWVVIEFESAQSSEITIDILNMLGKPVRRDVVQTVFGRNALEIDLANLEGGYYFVNITDGKRFLSEKLVKVKW